ncbi:chromosome segregation protein SMC [Candidatus Woesearchaeota archaeon]|nr:chromosome segregation protein SMC [Candidatus Woesearchaeota archaeon]MBT7106681.1 chromosome segregation protein SMC [Candidatus Woesearchaeota archaeon]
MTKINKLVMRGFKSFAKKTELIFGDDFNVILGPNGSGKSNVLDALCFVLGKSSAKALRSEKSANLIYNGGKSKKPASEAEVSIYFDNTKKELPTEEDQVKITRLVKPSGQSVYKINDVTRTRHHIIELLSIVKINPDGYNIILQGDIVRFCEMSPNDRRVLIEDISGIGMYEEKKNKAINELNKVEERLKEVEIILSERESRLKDLKKERDQALAFNDLNQKITQNKATYIYKNIKNKQESVDKQDNRIRKEREELDKANGEIQKIKYLIEQKKKEIEEINKEIEQKGEKDQVTIHKQVEELKIDLATSTDKVKNHENEIVKLNTRKENVNRSLAEIQAKIDTLFQQRNDTKKSFQSAANLKEEIEKKIKDFKKKNNLDNLGDIEKEVDILDTDAEAKQKEIQDARQQQQNLLREKDRIEMQIQSVDEKINKVLELQKENKSQLEELKYKKEEFKKTTSQLSKRINDDSSYAAQLGESRKKLMVANEELAKLRNRSVGIQEKIAGNIALKRILEEKKSIPGIYGTVSELGEVQTRYSLALEVAAGAKIKSVVVESDAVASKCISFLKENKLGIATFLPLNKIKGRTSDPKVKVLSRSNGAHGLAIDLITYDSKFKNVFEYVFSDTVVVENITTARRIGIGSAKMVTLDGDTAEVSGAMQGGFRKREKGLGFVEKEVSRSLKQYEKVSEEMEIKISSIQTQKSVNEEEIVKLREFKAHLEGDIIKLEKILHLDSGDTEANNKLRKELEQQAEKMDSDINKVQNTLSGMNRELAQNKIAKQELRNKINELRNPVLIAELNAFEEKRKELNETMIKTEAELNSIKAQVKNILEPEISNLNKVKRELKSEEENITESIKSTKKHISSLKTELTSKEKEQKRFQEQFKGLFGQRQKLSDEVSKQETKLGTYDERSRQAEHKINAISLESAKFKAELEALRQEYEPYKDVDLIMNKSVDQLKQEIYNAERRIERMGSINMRSLEIYDQIEKEYHSLVEKKERLRLEKEDVMAMMDEIEGKKVIQFMKTFEGVNEHFKNIFLALSTKGDASMVLENKEQPFDGGVLIKVKISGNKFMDIRSLSGGEKTMTALAFIFSIQEHDPASFYIMDEVDAALDKKNSERLAQLVKKYCDRAQYVVISHNDSVISEGDRLYGVSMDEHGVSKVVSLKV